MTAKEYRIKVNRLSRLNAPPKPGFLAPDGYRYVLDHIVDVQYCRRQKIPVELCASRENLRWISAKENDEKRCRPVPEQNALLRSWGLPEREDRSVYFGAGRR
jgi:hypothetical protein